MIKEKKSMFFEVQNPRIQQFLWRRIALDYPYTPWLMDGLICILFPASEFPRRVILVHNGTTIPILRFLCLSFHMIFAQPSISDLEPHSRGSRIDGERTVFSFPSMRHALLDCCSLTLSVHLTRSVANFTGHLVHRFQGGCQVFILGVEHLMVCIFL